MQRSTTQIIWLGLCTGYMSSIYFLSLVAGLPFFLTVTIIAVVTVLLYRYITGKTKQELTTQQAPAKTSLFFSGGLILLVASSLILMPEQGDWDSFGIWNFHARYLDKPCQWRQLFLNRKFSHTDYPALLPSSIAFLWRLAGRETSLVPFAISALTTLLIPVLLFLEIYRKHLVIATLVMISFAVNTVYIHQGLCQYADTLLAFFFLCAFICMQHYRTHAQPVYMLLCAGMLGCAMWTKNEGIMLAAIFALFYAKTFLKKENLAYTLAGILPFAIVLLLYKSCAPANDLVQGQHSGMLDKLLDVNRYELIFEYLFVKLNVNFYMLKTAVVLYAIYCIAKKHTPAKPLLLLMTCMAGYIMVYVFTPNDLEWHLSTSADRLVHQLLPAAMYVLALEASAALTDRRQQ